MAHGPTYQSSTMSNDIPRWHASMDYNPNEDGIPVRIDSYDGSAEIASSAGFHNPNAVAYRLAQSMRQTWWSSDFDWQTEVEFEIARFEAQFGMRYEEGTKGLPSYDESRLIYGR